MITKTQLPGVLVIEPKLYADDRGYFYESFNSDSFQTATGLDIKFVQDNHAKSNQGVVRGLHYQLEKPQAKLVRASQGTIFDVVVDLRKSSPTFGEWFSIELSEENRLQLWIPAGLAHGYMSLSDGSVCQYKTNDYRNPGDEYCLAYDDSTVNISWPEMPEIILSDKDKQGKKFTEIPYFG
jgi:dTDP-4-dehydrorhamnose 3,5-epimerase